MKRISSRSGESTYSALNVPRVEVHSFPPMGPSTCPPSSEFEQRLLPGACWGGKKLATMFHFAIAQDSSNELIIKDDSSSQRHKKNQMNWRELAGPIFGTHRVRLWDDSLLLIPIKHDMSSLRQ